MRPLLWGANVPCKFCFSGITFTKRHCQENSSAYADIICLFYTRVSMHSSLMHNVAIGLSEELNNSTEQNE